MGGTNINLNKKFAPISSSIDNTSINSNNIILGITGANSLLTLNGNLTVNGSSTFTQTIHNTNTIVETVVLHDSLINLSPDGNIDNINTGIYVNVLNNDTKFFSGLIRQNNTDKRLGTSYWYLFDSNSLDKEYCPNLSVDTSVGAILQVGSLLSTSDERLKVNIENIDNAVESINKLKGVRYNWKDSHGDREIGVIAQDINKEYPELIHMNDKGFLTVDYPKISAVLIEGIKELSKKVDNLKERIEILEKKI